MSFKQLCIYANAQNSEILSDIFIELDALSVNIDDQYEGHTLEQPIFSDPAQGEVHDYWQHSKLTVLFGKDQPVDEIIKQVRRISGIDFEFSLDDLDNKDWVRETQSQFNPIKINDNLYIVPSWHTLPDKNALAITLDPGLAFGTGSHATTFMCLDWLSKYVTTNTSILDYGCGSGILAIAAKILGAPKVVGIDIDSQAIEASKSNASINRVEIIFGQPEVLKMNNSEPIKFDLVVANILANPLRILAPALYKLTKHKLILSGILETQILELTNIYSEYFTVKIANIKDGWGLLECTI